MATINPILILDLPEVIDDAMISALAGLEESVPGWKSLDETRKNEIMATIMRSVRITVFIPGLNPTAAPALQKIIQSNFQEA